MSDDLVLRSTTKRVTTLTMNMTRRLNGWTMPMMDALAAAFAHAAGDERTRAVVLTGADPYYCAGVNLGSTIKPGHPRTLRALIARHNRKLFERFLTFPKPILVAANGPAIGASVTSATLCDDLIASDRATFSTPFAALGIPPEGCSSVLFPKILGDDDAQRMLGEEGFKPDAEEALDLGLVSEVVPHGELMARAQEKAESWVEEDKPRAFRAGTLEELLATNARESEELADAILSPPFLEAQYRFLRKKGKRGPAAMFLAVWKTRPLWGRLL